jgi:hypothetical protein
LLPLGPRPIRGTDQGRHLAHSAVFGSAVFGVPFVALVGLPNHHYQPAARPQRPPDVGKRNARVLEEHRAEPAHRQVEPLSWEGVDLRVGAYVGDVAQPLRPSELTRILDRGCRNVDAERGAHCGSASGLPGCLATPTPDVEDLVTDLDGADPAKHLVMPR